MKFNSKCASVVSIGLFLGMGPVACTNYHQHTHEREYQKIGLNLDRAEEKAEQEALRAAQVAEAAKEAYQQALEAQASAESARDKAREEKEKAKIKAHELVDKI
jgi:hypothetical protein